MTVNGQAVSMAGRSSPLRASDEVAHMMLRHEPPVWLPAGGLPAGVAVEWHGDIGVVNKPPGLPVHPCGAYHHNSLATLLGLQLGDGPPLHFPHRLDTVTSGLLLVARSKVAARRLARQLEPGAKGGETATSPPPSPPPRPPCPALQRSVLKTLLHGRRTTVKKPLSLPKVTKVSISVYLLPTRLHLRLARLLVLLL